MLRKFWARYINYNWVFGVILVLLFGIPRFILLLSANITGNYGKIAILFLLMILSPVIFLSKVGRTNIGIKKPDKYSWLIFSLIAGSIFCFAIFLIANVLYNHSISNWFVYISRSYAVSKVKLPQSEKLTYFLIYS